MLFDSRRTAESLQAQENRVDGEGPQEEGDSFPLEEEKQERSFSGFPSPH